MRCSAMRTSSSNALALLAALACAACGNSARTEALYQPTIAPPPPAAPANGAIFQPSRGYAALTSGARAAMVGDLLTIVLVERTQATKSHMVSTARSGEIGLAPPATGPPALFEATEIN